MATVPTLNFSRTPSPSPSNINPLSSFKSAKLIKIHHPKLRHFPTSSFSSNKIQPCVRPISNKSEPDPEDDEEVEQSTGVKAALSMLNFYRREISPLLPKSCRYVPSCSEYSIIAYKKYGVAKGTILTAWRLCRCNPLGGSGFDPPRWFGEERVTDD